jgi:hypothetical protein
MKKKLNFQLFNSSATLDRVEMGTCKGGKNDSNVIYVDTHAVNKNEKWDIAVESLIDIVDTSEAMDNSLKYQVATFEYVDMY